MAIANSLVRLAIPTLLFCAQSHSVAAIDFTDWTLFDATHGEGMLGPVRVTLTGDLTDLYPLCVTNGMSTWFNSSFFSPPLALSDVPLLAGKTVPPEYTISFDRPVTNPIMHLRSLASTLTFAGINPIKLSGQSTFVVSGNMVIGSALGPPPPLNDANGTILLPGTHTSITFTAYWELPPGQLRDTFEFQLGAASLCYPNCDGSSLPPILNVVDFACFLNAFATGDVYANCDASTTSPVLNVLDFACFLNAFAAGCS